MNNEERSEHLGTLQGIINRMWASSFCMKAASLVFAVVGFITGELTALIAVAGFWTVDAYFLRQERLFRDEDKRARNQTHSDYTIEPSLHDRAVSYTHLTLPTKA